MKPKFKSGKDFLEYNTSFKRWSGIFLITIICLVILTIILYFSFLRNLGIFEGTFFITALTHIKAHILNRTALGMFYVCFFGGLFFLLVPVDAYYVISLKTGRITPQHYAAIALGLLLSFSVNYIIGLRFSKFSKNLISPKKFYKTKTTVNRFGKLAILFLNLIGVCYQQLTFVLGVFRYNKTRLFIFALIGQVVKYTAITLAIIYFFQ